ncbi:MAG TPA: undecaprenyldiphospho-muramoylpentapeptide beta-N-acetylglucosaminyltransferase [Planctomycetota bacterium]|nr:undecaprenyldiphospho-muramoylpentapeptide beta-N-acetylglucosaminyltransferase [Planctomycetota bacterium]
MSRVCLVSGGTGGHLVPALALARALRASGREAIVLTEGRPAERALLEGSDLPARELPVARGLGLPFSLARAALASRRMLREEAVDLVIGTGGRASVPVAVAARSLGVPVCLLEQNAVPGRANRLLARFARRVWLGLPAARPLPHAVVTGTPLRAAVGACERARARQDLGLADDVPVLLVFGGSQGAAVLNEVVPAAVARLRRPLQVIHLAGLERDEAVRLAYEEGPRDVRAIVRPLARDMATLYAAADLVVCRGGGSTLAELIAAGRPAVIVPYPYHRDRQQWHNGKVLERAGAGLVVDQTRFDPPALAALLADLLADPDRLRAMGDRARGIVPEDACARILADLAAMEAD